MDSISDSNAGVTNICDWFCHICFAIADHICLLSTLEYENSCLFEP